jgi:DNA-binding NarL/FixJ family response regulator
VRYRTVNTVFTFSEEGVASNRHFPLLYVSARRGKQPALGSLGLILSHTIVIVDDSAAIRRLLRATIEQNGDWEVCGEADNGAAAIEKVKETHPDVVLLDFQMPVMSGLEAAREIAEVAPQTEMLMFTIHTCDQLVEDAHAAGITDVISKSDAPAANLLASLKTIRK